MIPACIAAVSQPITAIFRKNGSDDWDIAATAVPQGCAFLDSSASIASCMARWL
jgi:hypothetical protein